MSEVPRNIDEQIRHAMQRGEFDDLPGKGKPLDLSENPHEDPGWRTAYRMLKENGYTLPWIETRRTIELDFEKALKSLRQNWQWRSHAASPQARRQAEKEWQAAQSSFRDTVSKLNRRIRNYNLEVPSDQFHRRQINPDMEIHRICTSPD